MAYTEVSSLLHGSGGPHGTSEQPGVIVALSTIPYTQRNSSPTIFSNTENCWILYLKYLPFHARKRERPLP
jgi:hypothetical protein